MKEGFKEWLCELAEFKFEYYDHIGLLYILVKAMWAINREGIYRIWILHDRVELYNGYTKVIEEWFFFKKYNNSEQQALEKALEYIYENKEVV